MARELQLRPVDDRRTNDAFLNMGEGYDLLALRGDWRSRRLVRFATCSRKLHPALQLDLAELMCYTKHALIKERSGLSGKFATGGFWWLGALIEGRPDIDCMANLPLTLPGVHVLRDDAQHPPVFLCLRRD